MSQQYIACNHPEAVKHAAQYVEFGQSLIDKSHKAAAGNTFTKDKAGIRSEWQQGAEKLHHAINTLNKKIAAHGEYSKKNGHKVHQTADEIHHVDEQNHIHIPTNSNG